MNDFSDIIDALGDRDKLGELAKRERRPKRQRPTREVVVDKSGLPRQAGADLPEGEFIKRFRQHAERNLYVFSKGVMGRDYLTKGLHRPTSEWLQRTPPFRKLLLMPREHAKTSLVAHCLPIHILIQPIENNIYFPRQAGAEQRILLCGETETMASRNLRVVMHAFESNQLLRALWPSRVWPNPKRPEKTWNSLEIIIPRETAWPDASIRAIGVGGAITGARPTVLIKDDLISVEAANSEVVMQTAIDWHRASRALMEEYSRDTGQEALEYIIGTRWAVYDLYQHIIDEDPTVEILIRSIVEQGAPIWPERIDDAVIEQKKKEFGSMFWLLYMNSPANPDLVDFDIARIRPCNLEGSKLIFEETADDAIIEEKLKSNPQAVHLPQGAPLSRTLGMVLNKAKGQYLRLKYG